MPRKDLVTSRGNKEWSHPQPMEPTNAARKKQQQQQQQQKRLEFNVALEKWEGSTVWHATLMLSTRGTYLDWVVSAEPSYGARNIGHCGIRSRVVRELDKKRESVCEWVWEVEYERGLTKRVKTRMRRKRPLVSLSFCSEGGGRWVKERRKRGRNEIK